MEDINIRHAAEEDAVRLAEIEAECFPAAEAATEEQIRDRISSYGNWFWLLEKKGQIISFADGMVTDEKDLSDEMYENASLHDPAGRWQMIFGVNTIPGERRHGYAGRLLKAAISQAEKENRAGLVLTCKDRLLPYYAGFGFKDEGISASVHGQVVWHQMRLTF